ncbi:MAG: cofactor-independent phosphoglycerate mutase [bacterium]|nr:cofactor-independent phosphoglycerate mutase [Candidatus Margulisiibacteriota bacterium]
MKYLVLIGDGMSDLPLKQLKGKTPLEVAKTPNMDYLAQNGVCGWVNNVPPGLQPGSDVASMSIFGYDPSRYYTGRGPLEAASLGVKLAKNDVAFRCNLVTVSDGRMKDFTADHIETVEARKIIKQLDKKLGRKGIKFYPGLSYRHLLVVSDVQGPMSDVKTTPPHDITGKNIHEYLPDSKLLLELMNESEVILHGMETNATMIWPWGQGKLPAMPSFKKRYGLSGSVITAVDLLKGMGKTLGLEVINVPGATGYLDTNYAGKANYALKALKKHDIVFVHVEAPDEAGHEGSIKKKIKAIEDFDRLVVGTVLSDARLPVRQVRSPMSDVRILVLPDHPTPIKYMTHTRDAVPFVVWESNDKLCAKGASLPVRQAGASGGKMKNEKCRSYNEREIKKSKIKIKNGHELMKKFIGGKL